MDGGQSEPRLAWSQTGWDKFGAAVEAVGLDFTNLGSSQKVERAAMNYTEALQTAISAAVPRIGPKKK